MISLPVGLPEACLLEYRNLLGEDRVLTGRSTVTYRRDYSWYSPLLHETLNDSTKMDAVLRPSGLKQLESCVGIAAKFRVPVTLRGAGTGNYGQSLPLNGGVVIDICDVAGVIDIGEGRATVLPGTVMGTIDQAAHDKAQELAVMPTTFAMATASGFLCGGSGGIGAATNGDLWNGNVLAVELITVEEEPRRIRLADPASVDPVLHTYGTVGVVAQAELRLVKARRYRSVYATFAGIMAAAEFAWDVTAAGLGLRLVSLQPAPLPSMFTPVAELFTETTSAVLMMVAEEDEREVADLARAHQGELYEWPERPVINQFAYSHTILWSKKAQRGSSWLQTRYGDNKVAYLAQVQTLEQKYGNQFLQHVELNRQGAQVAAMGISPLLGEYSDRDLADVMGFCKSLGMTVLNPHSFVVEEGGFVTATEEVLELKRRADPYGLLNPGKLANTGAAPGM